MDLNYLRRLLKLFDESTLTELTIEEEGVTVRLARRPESSNNAPVALPQVMVQPVAPSNLAPTAAAAQEPLPAEEPCAIGADTHDRFANCRDVLPCASAGC